MHGHPFAWGGPAVAGRLRTCPEDFRVIELPLAEPSGEGEHAWLLIRKRMENTATVARRLAQCAGVPLRQVSYAGLKDRHAVAEQWFSVHLAGQPDPDWSAVNSENLVLIRQARHQRKLRRGALTGNAFRIRVQNVSGDPAMLENRLQQVAAHGVPNYFGEQRFGHGASNLQTASRLFAGTAGKLTRHQRGLALSAARSYLFNGVLGQRVNDSTWNRVIPGDALQLSGSHSFFVADSVDPELERRVRMMDVHPTGPLAGAGDPPVTGAARQLEANCLGGQLALQNGLAKAGLRQERRALRLPVEGLAWSWPQADCLELTFRLTAGAYATSVLRELVRKRE
ncbi:MAG: tRNA pseudouridine(13) synthase TruD [Gammaproteobacteria bacterium]|nr:MAG: tRNA pseudouridine(13) synthase TruD [Gammaproteobacteria bacterium]